MKMKSKLVSDVSEKDFQKNLNTVLTVLGLNVILVQFSTAFIGNSTINYSALVTYQGPEVNFTV